MTNTPLVSVVVPSYCHQDQILECLQSIHAQTWPRIELVVVDDASTDESWPKLQRLFSSSFTTRFEHSILLRNDQNRGAHATLNRGIEASQGSHIALINSDDLYHPDRLRKLMHGLGRGGDIGQGGQDLAFSLVNIQVDEKAPKKIDPFFRLFTIRQHLALLRDPTVGLSLVRANHAISTGNLLFTRRLWQKAGPFQSLQYCHDWDFILQSLFFTEPSVVTEPLYTYRLHASNSFRSLSHRRGIECQFALRRFLNLGMAGDSPNQLFPSAANWPDHFTALMNDIDLEFDPHASSTGSLPASAKTSKRTAFPSPKRKNHQTDTRNMGLSNLIASIVNRS